MKELTTRAGAKIHLFLLLTLLVALIPMTIGSDSNAALSAVKTSEGLQVTLYATNIESATIQAEIDGELFIMSAEQIEPTLWRSLIPIDAQAVELGAYSQGELIATLSAEYTETGKETTTQAKPERVVTNKSVLVTDGVKELTAEIISISRLDSALIENGSEQNITDILIRTEEATLLVKNVLMQPRPELIIRATDNGTLDLDMRMMDFTHAEITRTARGNSLYECVGTTCRWQHVREITPGEDYTITTTEEYVQYREQIDLINVQSYPDVGGEWTVRFTTHGSQDLTIRAVRDTRWSRTHDDVDLQFLTLTCGQEEQTIEWNEGSVHIANYTCEGQSSETSKVLTSGAHHLAFTFGNETVHASNMAGESGYKVQSGRETVTGTEYNKTLATPVADLNRAFVIRPHSYSGSPDTSTPATNNAMLSSDSLISVTLSELDTITFNRGGSAENAYADYLLIEALDNEFNVSRGSHDWSSASGTSITINIGTSVTAANTYAYVSTTLNTNDDEAYDSTSFHAAMINSTHLRISRSKADAGLTGTLRWVVVEFDPDKIDSIETGTTTVTNQVEATPRQVTLTTPVDPKESILLFQLGVDDSGLDQVSIAGRLTDTDTVEFYRSDGSSTRTIRYYVIDFGSGVGTKQNGTQNYDGTTTVYQLDAPLVPAINQSRAILWSSSANGGTGTAFPRPFWSAYFTTESNLRQYRSRFGTDNINEWQVLELPYTPPDLNTPAVTGLTITPTSQNLGRDIRIDVTVTDDRSVEHVKAIIDYNGQQTNLTMLDHDSDQVYNVTFTDTDWVGTYEITIWANDTGNNINSTEKSSIAITYDTLEVLTNKQSYLKGENASITATGFDANVPITLNIQDGTHDPVNESYPFTVLSNGTGAITHTWNIPSEQTPDIFTITATHAGTGRTAFATVKVVLAVIELDSATYEVGDTLLFEGSNWGVGENVTVHINDSTGTDIYGPLNITANTSGEFNGTYSIPWDETLGTHTIGAYEFTTPQKTDHSEFEVTTRELTITKDKTYYIYGDIATISGTRYRPGSTITLDITSMTGSLPGYPMTVFADGQGNFSAPFTINSSVGVGSYTITAIDTLYTNIIGTSSILVEEPDVTTDKNSYNIDEMVSITGTNWQQDTTVTVSLVNSNDQEQTGYPKNKTTNADGGWSDTWTTVLLGTQEDYTITVWQANNRSINDTKAFNVLFAATLDAHTQVITSNKNITFTGLHYTQNGDVTFSILSLANENYAPDYPRTITANSTGGLFESWNASNYCSGTYRARAIDQAQPETLTAQETFVIAAEQTAFPNADFSYNDKTNWQWLGSRYQAANDCGGTTAGNYNIRGIAVLNASNTSYFAGDWKRSHDLPIGGGGSEETTLVVSAGTNDYSGMMMTIPFIVPDDATDLTFFGYAYYISADTNTCLGNRNQGTLSQVANSDRAESLSFGVWVDGNADTAGNTNIADDYLIYENWESRSESGSGTLTLGPENMSVDVVAYRGETIYVTGIIMGRGDADDALIQLDNVKFTLNATDCVEFDSTPPDITAVLPSSETQYELLEYVNITANIVDNHTISSVVAAVTLPNTTTIYLTMTDHDEDDVYNASFTQTTNINGYNITITAIDNYGNERMSSTDFNVVDSIAPSWSGTAAEPPLATYDPGLIFQFNVTWIDNYKLANVTIEHDFQGALVNETLITFNGAEYSYAITNLAAGSYRWRMFANDTSGNVNVTDLEAYTISHASSAVNLMLNGSADNLTVEVHSMVNMTATRIAGEGDIRLYYNLLPVDQGQPTLTFISSLDETGLYNVTVTYDQTENFTRSAQTYFVTVEDTQAPEVMIVEPVSGTYVNKTDSILITANVTDNYHVAHVTAHVAWAGGSSDEPMTEAPATNHYHFTYVQTTKPGRYDVTINATDDENQFNDTQTTHFIVLDTLSVSVDQNSYVVNDTVTLSGTGFNPLVNVTVDITNATGSVVLYPQNVTSNETGGIMTTWSIPGTQALGDYTITVWDTTEESLAAETAFEIVSSVIQTLNTTLEQGQKLFIYGYNWGDTVNVTLNITDQDSNLVYGPVNLTSNSTGQVTIEWQVPYDEPLGIHTITARHGEMQLDSSTFTVNARETSIKTDQPWYWTTQEVNISGEGYSPSADVTISLAPTLPGYPQNVSALGDGSAQATIPLAAAQLANYTVMMKDFANNNLNASTQFLVTEQQASSNKQIYGNGETITITGKYWHRSANITIDILNQTGGHLTGYPVNITSTPLGDISTTLVADTNMLTMQNYSVNIISTIDGQVRESFNFTVLINSVSESDMDHYDQNQTIQIRGAYFTASGKVQVFVEDLINGRVDAFYPKELTTNSTGGLNYEYYTKDLCTGMYRATFTDITNPEELTSYLDFNITHIDMAESAEAADASLITGTYNGSGGSVSSTATSNEVWQYVAGIDRGYTTATINYTFDISSLEVYPVNITSLNLTVEYCHSGDQAGKRCNTGSNVHEGTGDAEQSIEIYNFTSGQWQQIGLLTVNEINDNEITTTIPLTEGFRDYIQNNKVFVRYEFNFSRTGFNDDLLLIDYQSLIVSYDHHVSRTCSPLSDSFLYIDTLDDDSQTSMGTTSTLSRGDTVLDEEDGDYHSYLYDGIYNLSMSLPLSTSRASVKIFNVNFTTTINTTAQIVEEYTGPMPSNLVNITALYALNDLGMDFTAAQVTLPLEGLNVTYLFHCTAWEYETATCGTWEEDEASVYGAIKNATHITFNVTEFDAFGGGPGDTLPNITSITLYDVTQEADPRTGGVEVANGLNTTFSITHNSLYRAEINITNAGRKWTIASEDIAYQAGLNESWIIDYNNDVWYTIAGTNYTGGYFNAGTLSWNLSLGGVMDPGANATWIYLFNTTVSSSRDYGVAFLIEDVNTSSGSTDESTYRLEEAQLLVNESSIKALTLPMIEGSNVTFNATIYNTGSKDATNFVVEGWDNTTGTLLYQQTISVSAHSSKSVLFNWTAKTGTSTIQLRADATQAIPESHEDDNIRNHSLSISAWHTLTGVINYTKTLGGANNVFHTWPTQKPQQNIYAIDADATIDWSSLQALGRKTDQSPSTNDFTQADTNLSMSGYSDSIEALYSTDGSAPKATRNLLVNSLAVNNIPVHNVSKPFFTGLLWDTSDDVDGEYSGTEDLVIVSRVNVSQAGAYGTYDYEMRVPSSLQRSVGGQELMYLYVEIDGKI